MRDALERVSVSVIHALTGGRDPASTSVPLVPPPPPVPSNEFFHNGSTDSLVAGSNEDAWQALTALLNDSSWGDTDMSWTDPSTGAVGDWAL